LIPVTVLTGFLGSGKTTLLRKLLRSEEFGRAAVIVNEFGEVGLDHELVAASDESLVQLTTGCLCCRVRSDLVLTLQDLAARRAEGAVAPFERVVIETSGLADPASILQALMTDTAVAEVYELGQVVTAVDTVVGAETLARHAQALRQAAAADVILLTKADLPQSRAGELERRMSALNPMAVLRRVAFGDIAPSMLLDGPGRGAVERMRRLGAHPPGPHGKGDADPITSTCFVGDRPVSAVALALFLQALAEHCGDGLLRMKGIVQVRENAARPAVIHGVQHVFHPPEWLAAWPGEERGTRMVFIGERPPPLTWVKALLEVLEDEVEEVSRRGGAAR
jgi:G3E family GTPase